MTSKNEQIGLRIKKLREENDLTILAFAEKIGIDNSSVGKIEKGKMGIPLPILLEICSKFNQSADWILNGIDNSPLSNPVMVTKEELLLKIYETALNTKAYEKANGEMIKKVYSMVSNTGEKEVNTLYASLVARFLSEG